MFRRRTIPSTAPPCWLIVGLGNPGAEYRGTRHNVGFEVIDLLCVRLGVKLDRSKHQARFAVGTIGEGTVALLKPMTFMNASGQAVAPFAREFSLKADRILVIADDLDMVVGRVRLKPKGSAGGHNGHKSIISALGTDEYPRLKIGIGSVNRKETIDHVLGPFSLEERGVIQQAVSKSTDATERLVQDGIEAAMNFVNA
jgi:peptidyl-tRNA hydrolase, PTH1 family